jgi:copper(I)-binding protein
MQVLPGKTMTSGYFDLYNSLPHTVELVGASSSAVSSIEMHEVVQDGDTVRMRRLSSVEIAPGTTLQFAKGAKHLMLFGVNELPENLSVTLKFADGRETAATFQQQRW